MTKIQVMVPLRCRSTPERIFDAWLDPAKARVWMATSLRAAGLPGEIRRVEIDPRIGGSFFFSDQRGEEEARHWGTYLELDRPRRIAFTWIVDESEVADPSRVTMTIEAAGDGSLVTLIHEMDAAWAAYVPQTEAGWTRMLHASDSMPPAAG